MNTEQTPARYTFHYWSRSIDPFDVSIRATRKVFAFLFCSCVFDPTNRSLSRQDIGTDVGLHHDHLVRIKEIKDGNRRLLF